jgi:shikimate dehydrogenase
MTMSEIEKKFGLLGKNIAYSFSKKYFTDKFESLKLDHYEYVNYDLPKIELFRQTVLKDIPKLGGLNVTIPYKESIIAYLDEVDEQAAEIAAVNTIKILKNNKLKGFNTDVFGFEKSLKSCWRGDEKKALILGTGGASKAVAFVLKKLGIAYLFVSRSPGKPGTISYASLNEAVIREHDMIINCSPLGTYPDLDAKPDLPYEHLTKRHLLYDLIYNPDKTAFLQMGEKAGATIMNGRLMLELQAEKSWEIWNS